MAWLEERLAAKNFVTPGPLLLAFQKDKPASSHANMPRAVVLIDEIDKADSDLPNALLGVLGDRSITVHPTGEVVASPRRHRPLIVITTNEDRELPAAFVRRCAVLNLRPDDTSEPAFVQWLFERASVHAQLASLASSSVFTRAGKQVWADRKAAEQNGLPTVGLAEYLDLLYSLCRVSGGDAARAELLLDQLAPFALVKHRDQNQSRAPVPLDPQA
jgi:MoxR-like ATPase